MVNLRFLSIHLFPLHLASICWTQQVLHHFLATDKGEYLNAKHDSKAPSSILDSDYLPYSVKLVSLFASDQSVIVDFYG